MLKDKKFGIQWPISSWDSRGTTPLMPMPPPPTPKKWRFNKAPFFFGKGIGGVVFVGSQDILGTSRYNGTQAGSYYRDPKKIWLVKIIPRNLTGHEVFFYTTPFLIWKHTGKHMITSNHQILWQTDLWKTDLGEEKQENPIPAMWEFRPQTQSTKSIISRISFTLVTPPAVTKTTTTTTSTTSWQGLHNMCLTNKQWNN